MGIRDMFIWGTATVYRPKQFQGMIDNNSEPYPLSHSNAELRTVRVIQDLN